MIPAPFMDRREIVRELEAGMLKAVADYYFSAAARTAWTTEALRDALYDHFSRKDPRA